MRHNYIYHGDCADVLKKFPEDHFALAITSPPYANKRGGPKVNTYVDWFQPIAKELYRVLRDDGSFVLNIKECVVKGERHTYVHDLIGMLRGMGWLWVEEYCWHKRNSFPGKWPNRFRDAFERCHHFTKNKHFCMYQDEVRVPIGDWSKSRLKHLSATDRQRDPSKVGSGFGKNVSNWVDRDTVFPTNVLHMATECGNKQHSSAFPLWLPEWFMRLFTKEGDTILDPFLGSGTSAVAAKCLKRKFVGIEVNKQHVETARERIRNDKGRKGAG